MLDCFFKKSKGQFFPTLLETMYKFHKQVSNPQLAIFVALAQLNV